MINLHVNSSLLKTLMKNLLFIKPLSKNLLVCEPGLKITFCNMPDVKIKLSMRKIFLYPLSYLHMAI